jgi:hypothetical protein
MSKQDKTLYIIAKFICGEGRGGLKITLLA